MIANIRTEKDHIEETISTLRFATRMMCVTTSPLVNVQYDPFALIKKYEKQIKDFKQELQMHDTLANRSHVQYEPFTESQKYELQKLVKAHLDNEDEELEIVNLRQIREVFNQFRILYKQLETENEENIKTMKANHLSTANGLTGFSQPGVLLGQEYLAMSGDSKDKTDLKDDDGVGETEGGGFGVGLAPSGGSKSVKDKKKDKESKDIKDKKGSKKADAESKKGALNADKDKEDEEEKV